MRAAQIEDLEVLVGFFMHACNELEPHRGGRLLVQGNRRLLKAAEGTGNSEQLSTQAENAVPAATSDAGERARSSFIEQLSVFGQQKGPDAHGSGCWPDTAVNKARAHLVLGFFGTEACGYVSASTYRLATGEVIATLDELYVQPRARRRGLGTALLDDVASWAASVGCSGLEGVALPGSRAMKGFFEAAGMRARSLVMHRTFEASHPERDESA